MTKWELVCKRCKVNIGFIDIQWEAIVLSCSTLCMHCRNVTQYKPKHIAVETLKRLDHEQMQFYKTGVEIEVR